MLVKKRLIGILGTVAIIAAACGSSTTSTAPSAAAPSAAASTAARAAGSAETPSGSPSGEASPSASASASASAAADLAEDQTLRVTLGAEDPATLDPSKASTSTDIGVLHALNRGLIYFDKDQNTVPSLAEALPEISADGLT